MPKTDLAGLLPLPYLDADNFSEANWAEIRRLKAACRDVYVRKIDDDNYEIIDGGAQTQRYRSGCVT